MTELVTRNYWWPEVIKNVGKYVNGCDMCWRMKNRTEAPVGKLMANEILEKPQIYLMVDFTTKLPLMLEKDVILVVCDWLSKMAHLVTTTEEISVKGLVQLLRDNVQKLHRLSESMISDRDLQFVVELMKELNGILEIETRLLTVFYPQTDGQTEWMNQELEQYLRILTEYRQRDWREWLATAEFAVNNKVYLVMKVSPFMANYSKELRIGVDIRRKGKVEKVTEFVKRMKKV